MELSKSHLENISLGHVSGSISDDLYQQLLVLADKTITKSFSSISKEDTAYNSLVGNDSNIQQFYYSLCTLLTEAARFGITQNEFQALVDDRLDEGRLKLLLSTYMQRTGAIRRELQRYGVQFASIVDFHWRMDYGVHSDTIDELKEITYLLTLVILDPKDGSTKDITFHADVAQLHDLLGQIKDAIAQKKGLE